MEAMGKIKEGQKFDDVARTFSEDKARQGVGQNNNASLGFFKYTVQVYTVRKDINMS